MIFTINFSSCLVSMRIYSRSEVADLILLSSHYRLLSPWLTAPQPTHSLLFMSIAYTRASTKSKDLCNIYTEKHLRQFHLCFQGMKSSHLVFPCHLKPFYHSDK